MANRKYLLAGLIISLLLHYSTLSSRAMSNFGWIRFSQLGFPLKGYLIPMDANEIASLENSFRRAQLSDPFNISALRGKSWQAFISNDADYAASISRSTGRSAIEWLEMGRLAARQGQIGAARRLFRVAAQLETGWGDPWLLQAILDLQNQDYPAALESLFEARARQLVETELSDLYYNTGEAYYYLSGADGSQSALASYSQALIAGQFSQASLAADAYYKRAVSYAKLGANAEISIPDLETAIAINPKHTWAHIMLGDLIFTARQDFARAEAELKTAISLSPGDKWPYRYLGSIYLRAGREEQALAMFHQVLALDPSDAPTAALVEQLSQP